MHFHDWVRQYKDLSFEERCFLDRVSQDEGWHREGNSLREYLTLMFKNDLPEDDFLHMEALWIRYRHAMGGEVRLADELHSDTVIDFYASVSPIESVAQGNESLVLTLAHLIDHGAIPVRVQPPIADAGVVLGGCSVMISLRALIDAYTAPGEDCDWLFNELLAQLQDIYGPWTVLRLHKIFQEMSISPPPF